MPEPSDLLTLLDSGIRRSDEEARVQKFLKDYFSSCETSRTAPREADVVNAA